MHFYFVYERAIKRNHFKTKKNVNICLEVDLRKTGTVINTNKT